MALNLFTRISSRSSPTRFHTVADSFFNLSTITRADDTKTHIRYNSEGMAVETIAPLGKSRQRSAECEKITLFVTISDDNEAEELENEFARVLNRPAVFDHFIERYEWQRKSRHEILAGV
ncbi:hypothetical protein OEJ37_00810 [Burkholderia sp. BKH01]|uniref:hypothetical protein n=1 Tax=Burkholderia sp. BKH01 TaxID=2769262 RepID=UPI0021E0B3B0|nr:hypothetical protein [Burkholderia sp. BKH01]MCU9951923.1 hypothetical protein [Burkholderia sp. BKH01]